MEGHAREGELDLDHWYDSGLGLWSSGVHRAVVQWKAKPHPLELVIYSPQPQKKINKLGKLSEQTCAGMT